MVGLNKWIEQLHWKIAWFKKVCKNVNWMSISTVSDFCSYASLAAEITSSIFLMKCLNNYVDVSFVELLGCPRNRDISSWAGREVRRRRTGHRLYILTNNSKIVMIECQYVGLVTNTNLSYRQSQQIQISHQTCNCVYRPKSDESFFRNSTRAI